MFKLPAILLLLLCFSFSSFSQKTIKGKVINAATTEPVAGSSVFISNSSKGTVTDKSGYFELTEIPAGKHDLIISSIGYETSVYSFTSEQLPLQLRIEMNIKVKELENVVVEPSVEEGWDKWGKLFTDNFLGQTPEAAQCKIKNYKKIRFRFYKKSNRLIAFSDEQLIIENKALGYIIKYQLEDFEVNFRTQISMYAGYPLFEEMEKNKKRWVKNRDKTYYGSMMHFMRSLYKDKLAENGYEVRRMVREPNLEKERVKKIYRQIRREPGGIIRIGAVDTVSKDSSNYYERVMQQKDYTDIYARAILTKDSLLVRQSPGYISIYFTDYLAITYSKELEAKEYLAFFNEKRNPTFQRSLVWLASPVLIEIDEKGAYFPPQQVFLTSYWGWQEKISSLLPLDYMPSE
jgi:CarboxypepD_reg-like domain